MGEALFVVAGCSERSAGHVRAIGNPFQYRDTWIRDAARQVSALAQWGLDETAVEMATDLLQFQGAGGDFTSQPGQLDGTGQAMWALGEVHGRRPAAPVPDSIASAIARAWRWCETRRALIRERAPEFAGLMPPADPRDNELAAGYLFGTDAWTLAGYRSAEALLERAGGLALADSVRRSADAYAGALEDRVTRAGGAAPASWSGRARDWGNLAALVPTGALAPTRARARWLSAIDRASPARGLATYGTSDTVHLYLGSDLALSALLLGRADLWRSALDATLAAQTGTGGIPEMFCWATRSFGGNLPPHATSAAALLVLIRQALVFDAFPDTLRLTLGTRVEWWNAGSALDGVPTRWGRLSLRFHRDGDRVAWDWTPVPVWTVLTLPPGARRASNARDGLAWSETQVLVPPGRGHVEVACVPR